MPRLIQKVSVPSRNTKVFVENNDYPSFDVIVNGEKYETHPQTRKRISDGTSTSRSIRTARKVQNSNSLQRAIRDRMYKTAEGVSYY